MVRGSSLKIRFQPAVGSVRRPPWTSGPPGWNGAQCFFSGSSATQTLASLLSVRATTFEAYRRGAWYAERRGGRRHRLTSEVGRAISSTCCRADAARLRDDSVSS